MWGCDKSNANEPDGQPYDLGGERIFRCPNALLAGPWIQQALFLYGCFKEGHLPNGKGLNQETAHLVEVIRRFRIAENNASEWFDQEFRKKGPK